MDGIRTELRGNASWITLDNPDVNGLHPGLVAGLIDALRAADEHPDVTAVVLTGAGDVFCGGVDAARLGQGDPAEFGEAMVELFKTLPALGVAVIAAVNGDALMSGFSLVCASDIVVAAEGARLGTTESSLGAWPMVASVPVLHTLGRHHAFQNILTGEPFDAQRAYEIGVVNEVVPADRLRTATESWVARATRSRVLAGGRRNAERFLSLPYDEALEAALTEFVNLFTRSTP
ncbi:2,3-dehydroadipyl-CoA hydratase [Streptomyces sp. RB17]|uniref:enoyl-CoA hydratase/isomerase family protein n=1 Tax=Streptomyces sp. RB17 TaxID=2585197 RepID=UPI001296EC42|nr:enoyl-CoA hydratase/isomerase family protein [Streptomyces sp. RB17]MQY38735.1 2,3-dehydroadipyl-CoA hydratase [Streptomyces sp. RB17]